MGEEISRDVKLGDDALAQIAELYGNRGATELVIACCWFNLISRLLESTRVELGEAAKPLERFDRTRPVTHSG